MTWPTITLFPQPYDARAAFRVTQWCFIIVLGIAVLVVAIVQPEAVLTPGALLAAVLVASATLFVLVRRATIIPSMPSFYLVPVVDALAIASLRAESPELWTGALLALVVPAVWLGTSGLVAGIALAGVVSAAAVVPDIVAMVSGDLAVDAGTLSLVVLVPVAMTVTALFAFGLVDEAEAATTAESTTRRLRDAIVETVDVGIIVLDAEGEVVLVNRGVRVHPIMQGVGDVGTAALRSIRAYQADGITPYPDGDGPIRMAMLSDDSTDEVFWAHRADGTPHAFTARSTRLRDDRDTVVAIVIVLNDVTRFLDAVRARDRLISTVSHELRTPLTAMRGFLELARDDVPDPTSTIARHLAVVDRHLQREHAIVEQFILAADSFKGRLKLRPESVDLTETLRQVVAASTLTLTRPGVTMQVIGDPVRTRVDPALISTAVDALLSNAVAASSDGGSVVLTISAPEHGWARVEVTDHGVGIAEVDHAQLFEPFFRTERAHSEAAPGVGLGLPLVKQIAHAHGGTVEIKSTLGSGTTVVLLLPTEGEPRGRSRERPA